MTPSIAERIASTVPVKGCKVKTLRCVLHDVEAAPLDYAIQGLTASGRYVIDSGFIRPVLVAADSAPYRPDRRYPWNSPIVPKGRR